MQPRCTSENFQDKKTKRVFWSTNGLRFLTGCLRQVQLSRSAHQYRPVLSTLDSPRPEYLAKVFRVLAERKVATILDCVETVGMNMVNKDQWVKQGTGNLGTHCRRQ